MKNKIIVTLSLMVMPLMALAQGAMSKVFVSMPDTMLTYLDSSQRQELSDDVAQKQTPVVVNTLGDSTKIVKLTADYLKLDCNKARTLEIKLLPQTAEGDTIVCVVNTFKGPAEESTLAFYDLKWNRLNGQYYRNITSDALLQKPDSVSDDDFSQLKEMLDPMLVKLSLSPSDRSLTFSVSVPNVPKDKKKQIEALISQTKLNWDGSRFN